MDSLVIYNHWRADPVDGTGREDQKRDEGTTEDLRRRVKKAEHLKRAADRYAAEADIAAQEASAELAQAKADIARLEATAAKLTLALRDADEKNAAERRAGREDAAQAVEDHLGSYECACGRRAPEIARGDGVQPTEEQRARNEDQKRVEEEYVSLDISRPTRSDIESVAYLSSGGFLSDEVNFEVEEDEDRS